MARTMRPGRPLSVTGETSTCIPPSELLTTLLISTALSDSFITLGGVQYVLGSRIPHFMLLGKMQNQFFNIYVWWLFTALPSGLSTHATGVNPAILSALVSERCK